MPRRTLSDAQIANLKPRAARYAEPVPQLTGLYVRVQPTGSKTFVCVAVDPTTRKQVWHTIGAVELVKVAEACELARTAIKRIKAGLPPVEEKVLVQTLADVFAVFDKRHIEAKKLRTAYDLRREFNTYIAPRLGGREIGTIKRSEITRVLDEIEDENGTRTADKVLSALRSLFRFHASRDDDFVSPLIAGMNRVPAGHSRDRVLTDEELRIIWKMAGEWGAFGVLVKVALLTAQRLQKLLDMQWTDIDAEGVWTIRTEAREKGNPGRLKLPQAALDALATLPRHADNPFVFAVARGKGALAVARPKKAFDEATGITGWSMHDLRRSARSLMSRAGVQPHIAEKVLGHSLVGVEKIYDRHQWHDEIAAALAALASLLGTILDPAAASNVVPLRA